VSGDGGLTVGDAVLPGTRPPRAVLGVRGPADVPRWASASQPALFRAAAAAAVAARTLRTTDAIALDRTAWRGGAAQAAGIRAAAVLVARGAAAAELDRLAGTLDALGRVRAGQPALVAPATAWAVAGDAGRPALVDRWRVALDVADAADARTAAALAETARTFAAIRLLLQARRGVEPPDGDRPAPPGPVPTSVPGLPAGALPGWATAALRVGAEVVDGGASAANAALHHPVASAELLLGTILMDLGANGELGGAALDVTGVGTVPGVALGVASAAAIAAGAGLATMGAGELATAAAGDDAVTPIDLSDARWTQKGASSRFSKNGAFKERPVSDVAEDLRAGRLSPDDVPVEVIRRDGRVLIVNTRSSLALEEAGIPRSEWKVVDRTGDRDTERTVTWRLRQDRLDSEGTRTVKVRGS